MPSGGRVGYPLISPKRNRRGPGSEPFLSRRCLSSRRLPPDVHAVAVIDIASRHIVGELTLPANLTRLNLRPHSTELNTIEKVWLCLMDRCLGGRLFTDTDHIVDACCNAWNNLIAEPSRIRSRTTFDWASGAAFR